MKTTGNTMIITGGSAGIGLEFAKLFAQLGNTVIITGRSADRLQSVKAQFPELITFQGDVNKPEDVERLYTFASKEYPQTNVLINNAGSAFYYKMAETNAYEYALQEITTNYLSVIQLTDTFLPLLKKQPEAAIVNVTSIAALVPSALLPTYGASKAALHFYSFALRQSFAEAGAIKLFEIMPPLVNTEFSKAIGGENGISPAEVATDLLIAFEKNMYEVPVGATKFVHQTINNALENIKLG